jgi:hypothetical protein
VVFAVPLQTILRRTSEGDADSKQTLAVPTVSGEDMIGGPRILSRGVYSTIVNVQIRMNEAVMGSCHVALFELRRLKRKRRICISLADNAATAFTLH